MRTALRTLGISISAVFLTGCLESKQESLSSSASTKESIAVTAQSVSSLSSNTPCNTGQSGSLVFDRAQNTFYTCVDSQWVAINLQGGKGDKGDTGPKGDPGNAGANGTNGVNGMNGRDGIDGTGLGLVLRDGATVRGSFMQYAHQVNDSLALISLPNKDLIYVNVNTGEYASRAVTIYFTGAGCTGTAYSGRTDVELPPHVPGRIFVTVDNSLHTVGYWRVEAANTQTITYNSYLDYFTSGSMGVCRASTGTRNPLVRVVQVAPPPSLAHLAPISFSN